MWGKGDSEDSAPKEEKHTLRFHDLRLKPGHSYPCRRVRRDCKWRVFCGLPNDVCIFLWLQLLSRSTATAFWGPRRGAGGEGNTRCEQAARPEGTDITGSLDGCFFGKGWEKESWDYRAWISTTFARSKSLPRGLAILEGAHSSRPCTSAWASLRVTQAARGQSRDTTRRHPLSACSHWATKASRRDGLAQACTERVRQGSGFEAAGTPLTPWTSPPCSPVHLARAPWASRSSRTVHWGL